MKRGKVVICCGLIGAGKSSLSKELADVLGTDTLWLSEPDEKGGRNPYLSAYYSAPERWAFTMQVHLLSTRFRQHLQAQWHVMNTGSCAVMDSSYWSDSSFARLQLRKELMTEDEFATYASLYQAMTASVLLPNVCLRLLTSPETSNRRIQQRMEKETGRKCEVAISLDYLKGLDQEITHMTNVLRDRGVTVFEIPWDEDRGTPEDRRAAVEGLAARVMSIEPVDPFLDLHRRTT